MQVYTDIAAELYAEQRGTVPRGVKVFSSTASGIHLTRVEILREGLRRAKGCYITLDMPNFAQIDERDETFVLAIASQLRTLLPAEGSVLVVGIGNRAVTPDALGPVTVDKVFVTPPHAAQSETDIPLRGVAALAPGVEGSTGLPTLDVLQGLVRIYKPAAVLCIDSLCTASPARLGCSVQLSSAGLAPRNAPHITSHTLGVPVIALGVPTVTQAHPDCCAPMLVTPKDIDAIIRHGAGLLALAINKALQPALRVGELSFLTS